MAGDIMRQTMEILSPHLSQASEQTSSVILLGTIAGDIHDLGKNLFANLARFNGFKVVDLGVDVPPETFLAEAQRQNPDVIGISCVFTNAVPELKAAVELLQHELPSPRPPVIVGGTCIDEQISRFINADFWARDAAEGLKTCKDVVKDKDDSEQD
jgi:methanogenic corrinoid protein MtbC1